MADFKTAYKKTSLIEGGYVNNSSDHGGETIYGIARKFWPNWPGWAIVDSIKASGAKTAKDINKLADANPQLEAYKLSFYKQNFWDVNKLDLINDQQLANNVYDFGVNSGVSKGAKTLQAACCVEADGIIGPKTIACVNSGNAKAIYEKYNTLRSEFYHRLAANPGQLQFLKSWMSRVKPYIA